MDRFNYTGTGPGEHANYLRDLRAALNSGQIDAATFLKLGQPVAQEAYKLTDQLGSGGSGSANSANQIRGVLNDSGFKNTGVNGEYKILPNLPMEFETQIRESLLPPGLTPEQKAAYLKEIPEDIQFGSDQYNIEKEGLRQKLAQEQQIETNRGKQKQYISELSSLLSKQADTNFQRSIPEIAEQANTAGVFRSSGYGRALAEQQGRLQQDITSQMGQAQLAFDSGNIEQGNAILANAQGFQTSGLNRSMGLADYQRQLSDQMMLADKYRPQNQGKTSGEKWAQGVNTGAGAVTAVSGAIKGK